MTCGRSRGPDCRELTRRLLLVVVIAGALGSRAMAAPSISAASSDQDDHSRYCKCGDCDPKSCCCGPRRPAPEPPAAGPSDARPERSAPCLKSIPCNGGAGLPSARISFGGEMAAAFMPGWDIPPPSMRLPGLPPAPCLLPTPRATRLDDPPEDRTRP